MRPTRLVTIAAATAAALALGSAPVSGQEPDPPPITVDPVAGPAGTTITVSGDGCDANGAFVTVTHTGDADRRFYLPSPSDDNGSWSNTYTLGDDDPLGTYSVEASCIGGTLTDIDWLFEYAPATLQITDGPVVPAVLSMAIDPTSGPVGTTITVSGADCPNGELQARLLSAARFTNTTGIVDETVVDVTASGAWSVELVVNDTMSFLPIGEADVEPGDAYVRATCFIEHDLGDGQMEGERLDSEPLEFVITPSGTAPGHDEPRPSPNLPGSRQQASPATPVVAEPSYTG